MPVNQSFSYQNTNSGKNIFLLNGVRVCVEVVWAQCFNFRNIMFGNAAYEMEVEIALKKIQ